MAEARGAFERFAQMYDPPYGQIKPDSQSGVEADASSYLQEFIQGWLEHGDGVEFTGRNYETYLRVVIELTDAALRGYLYIDYKGTREQEYSDARPRKVIGVHEPVFSASYFLDRAQYEVIVYRREHEGDGTMRNDYSKFRRDGLA